jgi:polyphosphate kinase
MAVLLFDPACVTSLVSFGHWRRTYRSRVPTAHAGLTRLRHTVPLAIDESFEPQVEMVTVGVHRRAPKPGRAQEDRPMKKKEFEEELAKLQLELVRMLEWIRQSGHKLVILFEGRDAAGKGGAIKRISEPLNPRFCRVTALPAPTERERSQWYFQRYVTQLPAGGEMVLFDRSWYNRAGVERVMGFCTDAEYWEFLRSVSNYEQMLQRSGIQLVKYWFSVSDQEQERRFQARIDDPAKNWKISPMDMYARSRWVDYSKAKDIMMEHTSTPDSPWWEVDSDDKKRARLNCIHHLLSLVPYQEVPQEAVVLPPRQEDPGYQRPPIEKLNWIPAVY